MSDNRLERLEALARERWDDDWAIEQKHWADGTTSEYAYHVRGPSKRPDIDGTVVEQDQLVLDDEGRYVVYRVERRIDSLESEIVADPFDLVDESSITQPWVKDSDDLWHLVKTVDGDERTVGCGKTLTERSIDEMASFDPSDPPDADPDICEGCRSREQE